MSRFSFPVGFPMVVYPVLALAASSKMWWAPIVGLIAAAIASVFTWEAFSRKEFEAVSKNDPSMNIETWRFNWLAFFSLPGYLVALYACW
jgi:hypothetical protein